jgi:NAD-dependent SIR2 family protein deacetylase
MLHDPLKEINEVRNQLSYSKRIGFFLGAGTSKSIGISALILPSTLHYFMG